MIRFIAFPPLPKQKQKAETAPFGVRLSALATVLVRRSGRSAALPYPPTSARILSLHVLFATGRFFNVKVAGFS